MRMQLSRKSGRLPPSVICVGSNPIVRSNNAPLVQRPRTPVSHTGEHEFESRRECQFEIGAILAYFKVNSWQGSTLSSKHQGQLIINQKIQDNHYQFYALLAEVSFYLTKRNWSCKCGFESYRGCHLCQVYAGAIGLILGPMRRGSIPPLDDY